MTAFAINDGIYGSTFYLATLVFMDYMFLLSFIYFSLFFTFKSFYTTTSCGFESAAWYWHFVEVCCLVIFIFIYLLVWGSL